jgi:hypothetical protein
MIQVNAKLTTVTGASAATGGGADDWDAATPGGPATDSPAGKWAGNADAYFSMRRTRVQSASGADVVAVPTLIVDAALADAIPIDENDVITFVTEPGQTIIGTAQVISGARLASMPADVQTTRITLTLADPLAA